MKTIYYDDTGQVQAIAVNCKQLSFAERFNEIDVPDDMNVTRDHKITISDGKIKTIEDSINTLQPNRQHDPSLKEVLLSLLNKTEQDYDTAKASLIERNGSR